MKNTYFGTKQLIAKPMLRAAYCIYRGWDLPDDENGDDDGYLVEYLDGGGANHPDHLHYISWSPKDVFDRTYQPSTALSFGHAIEAMKLGHKVARAGWNGKGMWVARTPASSFEAAYAKDSHAARHRAVELVEGSAEINLLPHFDMRAADGSMVVGWLASQTDMDADDWQIV